MDIVDLLVLIAILSIMVLLSVKNMPWQSRHTFSIGNFKQPDLSLYEFGKQTTTVNSPSMFP